MTSMPPTTTELLKRLHGLLIEKYRDNPEKVKILLTVLENALDDPDWHTW